LQVVKQDKTVQLAAFFKDFNHGSCINFVMKSTDIFESFSRSGLYYVRIVDAKFALPKTGADATKDFICLDMPEYPGEHDDINIGFETESGLTAPVSSATHDVTNRIHSTKRLCRFFASKNYFRFEDGFFTKIGMSLRATAGNEEGVTNWQTWSDCHFPTWHISLPFTSGYCNWNQ
jgi:hypothetical protein